MNQKQIIKTLSLILFFQLSFSSIKAQHISYDDLSSLTTRSTYTSYEAKSGAWYRVGDTITLSKASGVMSNYQFVWLGQGWTGMDPLPSHFEGSNLIISKIRTGGNKRTGMHIWIYCKGITLLTVSIQLENAISNGEIESFGMTSDEALEELKKAKTKLDLDVITQEEYDSIKKELIIYID